MCTRENVSIPLPSEHPPPPGPPYALLSPSCSGVGLYPSSAGASLAAAIPRSVSR
jgi:hypothetical protein